MFLIRRHLFGVRICINIEKSSSENIEFSTARVGELRLTICTNTTMLFVDEVEVKAYALKLSMKWI